MKSGAQKFLLLSDKKPNFKHSKGPGNKTLNSSNMIVAETLHKLVHLLLLDTYIFVSEKPSC